MNYLKIENNSELLSYLKRFDDKELHIIALDIEVESNLHVYGEKLCLAQIFDGVNNVIIDPFNIDARERMRDVLLKKGDNKGATEQLYILADAFREAQPEGSIYYCHEMLRIDPSSTRARQLITELGGVMPEDLDGAPDQDGYSDFEPSLDENDTDNFPDDEESVSIEQEVADAFLDEDSGLLLDDAELIEEGGAPLTADQSGLILDRGNRSPLDDNGFLL